MKPEGLGPIVDEIIQPSRARRFIEGVSDKVSGFILHTKVGLLDHIAPLKLEDGELVRGNGLTRRLADLVEPNQNNTIN